MTNTTDDTNLTAAALIEALEIDTDSIYGYLDEYLGMTRPHLIPADLDNRRATLIDAIEFDLLDRLDNDALLDDDNDLALSEDPDYRRLICTIAADQLLV